jgi:hypothetical protein
MTKMMEQKMPVLPVERRDFLVQHQVISFNHLLWFLFPAMHVGVVGHSSGFHHPHQG